MKLQHARVELHLRTVLPGPGPGTLSSGPGPGLLVLHELGGSADDFGCEFEAWPGAVHAIDFSGHGRSGRLSGGAYSPELLAGDADAALAELGPCCLAGRGIGAYVALLLAGGRPDRVPAALLLVGRGLAGGGAAPDRLAAAPALPEPAAGKPKADPAALRWLQHDLRPEDYAEDFARGARALLLLEDGEPRPAWWEAARGAPTARSLRGKSPIEALLCLAQAGAGVRS